MLNLIPNPVVGYRIRGDAWNWTVVLVKRHGPESAQVGQEYEIPLAYCKNLATAVNFILNRDARLAGEFMPLLEAFHQAQERALAAVADLEARLAPASPSAEAQAA